MHFSDFPGVSSINQVSNGSLINSHATIREMFFEDYLVRDLSQNVYRCPKEHMLALSHLYGAKVITLTHMALIGDELLFCWDIAVDCHHGFRMREECPEQEQNAKRQRIN